MDWGKRDQEVDWGKRDQEVDCGKRDQEDSCPRQTDEARGTAVDDVVVRNTSKILWTVFKGGDTKIAGSESGNTNVDTL